MVLKFQVYLDMNKLTKKAFVWFRHYGVRNEPDYLTAEWKLIIWAQKGQVIFYSAMKFDESE